jgi:tellurite resistance protein TerC
MNAVRRIVITVVGGMVLLAGVAMILLPGPAFIVIPAGLAILALEFPWAKRWLAKAREFLHRFTGRKEKPL